jgi:hypothetical protein
VTLTALPLSIRDVAPGEGATRLTGVRSDGLPDGVHTGGGWLLGSLVYKPLDGRPCPNADAHYPTNEAVCLGAMAGQLLFPRNWWTATLNGRAFLVRPVCQVLPRDLPWSTLTEADALRVEGAVRALNEAGWEMNDPVNLGRDPEGQLFLMDFSAAHHVGTDASHGADELWRIDRWLTEAGFTRLQALRDAARAVLAPMRWRLTYHQTLQHVYVCPDPAAAEAVPGSRYLSAEDAAEFWLSSAHDRREQRRAEFQAVTPGWLVTPARLADTIVERLGLTWGWSPLRHKEAA